MNCFGCINLRQKQYYIFNEQYTKEKYFERLAELGTGNSAAMIRMRDDLTSHFAKFPRKYSQILNSEECTGCYIADSKNCKDCFHAVEARDCRYGVHVWRDAKDCMDVDTAGRNAELIYETINCGIDVYHNLFCMTCWTAQDLLYCDFCHYSKHCFGCVGLQHKEYCILNMQFTREEYETIVPKIIDHMRGTGEWGEFFPSAISCFGYNETAAADSFPLKREEALARGYKWHEDDNAAKYQGRQYAIPDDIESVKDDIAKAILLCGASQKPYRIIPQELAFYRTNHIPIPTRSPEQRHKERMARRLPRKLWERRCSSCDCKFSTPYEKGRSERILCEDCFAKALV